MPDINVFIHNPRRYFVGEITRSLAPQVGFVALPEASQQEYRGSLPPLVVIRHFIGQQLTLHQHQAFYRSMHQAEVELLWARAAIAFLFGDLHSRNNDGVHPEILAATGPTTHLGSLTPLKSLAIVADEILEGHLNAAPAHSADVAEILGWSSFTGRMRRTTPVALYIVSGARHRS